MIRILVVIWYKSRLHILTQENDYAGNGSCLSKQKLLSTYVCGSNRNALVTRPARNMSFYQDSAFQTNFIVSSISSSDSVFVGSNFESFATGLTARN